MTRAVRKAPVVARLSRPWTSVPIDLMEEKGLSTTARLVLLYLIGLAGRPGWTIYVGQVCAALGLGEYAWTKARKQLEERGFYWSERRQESDGTWAWVHVVTDLPTEPSTRDDDHNHPPNPSIPGKPGDGLPGHGNPGDIRSKRLRTNKESTTTTDDADPASELVMPSGLAREEVVVAQGLVSTLPVDAAQQVLDELAGAMAQSGRIKTSPVGFLNGLVQRVRDDKFNPALGVAVAKARRQRAEQARIQEERRAEHKRRQQAANSESAQRAMKTEFEALSKKLGFEFDASSRTGSPKGSAG